MPNEGDTKVYELTPQYTGWGTLSSDCYSHVAFTFKNILPLPAGQQAGSLFFSVKVKEGKSVYAYKLKRRLTANVWESGTDIKSLRGEAIALKENFRGVAMNGMQTVSYEMDGNSAADVLAYGLYVDATAYVICQKPEVGLRLYAYYSSVSVILSSDADAFRLVKGAVQRISWSVAPSRGGVAGKQVLTVGEGGTATAKKTINLGTLTPDSYNQSTDWYRYSANLDTRWVDGLTNIDVKVTITDAKSGVVDDSGWHTYNLSSPTATVNASPYTGNVYKGFASTFRWQLTPDKVTNQVSLSLPQTAWRLDHRAKGLREYTTISGTGGATSYKMPGDVLPVGEVEWRVTVVTDLGYEFSSDWETITNVELPITIDGLYPSGDARALKPIVTRFGWTFSAEDDGAPGLVTQTRAVLYWRCDGGSWHQKTISGQLTYYDMPAGTLTGSSVEWYVVVTASTGTVATSEHVTVSTLDTLSTPVAISPAGTFVDDTTGCEWRWLHVNATGTAQTAYELAVSYDAGGSWAVLLHGEGSDNSSVSGPKALTVGSVYWRVRTKNVDGSWGNWSDEAVFVVRRRPDAPTIGYCDNLPLCTLGWQAESQTGYEVEVDGTSLGASYGEGKSLRLPVLLEDGRHTVRVRVCNQFGDWSDWTALQVTVANQSGGEVPVTMIEQWAQVRISLDASSLADPRAVCILRDGALVAVLPGTATEYLDRESEGSHAYVVRVFGSDGYYTDSVTVWAKPRLPYAALGLLDGEDWVAVKYAAARENLSRELASPNAGYVNYYGRRLPVYEDDGSRTQTLTVTFVCPADVRPTLEAMAGQTVVYKDSRGQSIVGSYAGVSCTSKPRGRLLVSISIGAVDREAASYDDV